MSISMTWLYRRSVVVTGWAAKQTVGFKENRLQKPGLKTSGWFIFRRFSSQ
jgi:hypothetical protein